MKPKYSWRPNSNIPISAEKAGQHIDLLKQRKGGEITPTELLEDAKSARSPLHKAFEWDNSKAAEQHRLARARHILGSIVIEVRIRRDRPSTPMRAYVNVRRDDKSTYVGLDTALSEKQLRAQVIERALLELESWVARHQQYPELKHVVDDVEHALRFRQKKAAE